MTGQIPNSEHGSSRQEHRSRDMFGEVGTTAAHAALSAGAGVEMALAQIIPLIYPEAPAPVQPQPVAEYAGPAVVADEIARVIDMTQRLSQVASNMQVDLGRQDVAA